jgi:hypothetical protein
MKLCPRCRFPVHELGRVIATTVDSHHAVVGVCQNCVNALERRNNNPAIWHAFLSRAVCDPRRYSAKILPDADVAAFAVALCGHPDWAVTTIIALGLMG